MVSKVVIPHLFEIKTRASNIYGFTLFDLSGHQKNPAFQLNDNYPKPSKTYFYEISKDINLPKKFEAIYRWYLLSDQKIYYQRPIIKNFSFKLRYDLHFNRLTVSPAYHHLIRFELGNIWPPGKILANFIADDLQKLGFGAFHGIALKFKNKVVCVFAPGGNFKTPLLKAAMAQGAEYISGDKIIIKDGDVYFLPPLKSDEISINCEKITAYKYKITHVFFIFRSGNATCQHLKNSARINSYLNVFNLFNFLGTGWALNFRRMIDTDKFTNDWYNFLNLRRVRNIKLIKEENFSDLINLFLKELA